MADPRELQSGSKGTVHANLFWMGGEEGAYELQASAADTPLDVLVEERDLKELFGYASTWEPEKKTLDLVYTDYGVDDFGLPRTLNNYFYSFQATGYLNAQKTDMPKVGVQVRPAVSTFGQSVGLVGESGIHTYEGVKGLSEYRYHRETHSF
jgi:hypothetical protein